MVWLQGYPALGGRRRYILIGAGLLLFGLATLYYSPGLDVSYFREYTLEHIEQGRLLQGRPFNITTVATSGLLKPAERLPELLGALKMRYSETFAGSGTQPEYVTCDMEVERYAATALINGTSEPSWQRDGKKAIITIAADFFNSEKKLPAQSTALLEAIALLLPHNRIYVSVYENGSTDKTPETLADFAAALEALGVDGVWVRSSDVASNWEHGDRIVKLAAIRNRALEPLMPYAKNGTLLFINDEITCASDILELVHQARLQEADMVMGMDWHILNPVTKEVKLYDIWVARGINGDNVYPWIGDSGYLPVSPSGGDWVRDSYITQDENVYQRWLRGLPIPVYSGWGGMAAFKASLFVQQHLRFRSSVASGWVGNSTSQDDWDRLVSTPGYLDSDCPGASECEYVARDIWNLRNGSARIVLAPQARAANDVKEWNESYSRVPATRITGAQEPQAEFVDWSKVAIPAQVKCLAGRTREGAETSVWDEDNHQYLLDPLFHPDSATAR